MHPINKKQYSSVLRLSLLLLLCCLYSCDKQANPKIKEIESKDYHEIYKLFSEAETDAQRIFYGERFLEKAKKDTEVEDQETKIVVGYRMLSVAYTDENALTYSDSIIMLTIDNPNKYYPGTAFEKKGDFFFEKRAYQRATDNYLQFYNYAEKFDQKDMISRAQYSLGIVKRRLGETDSATELYRKNFVYNQKHKDEIETVTYLNSISALANIFNDVQNVDSATYYNQFGYKEATRLKNEQYQNHFGLNQGVTNYYKKSYQVGIDSINKYLPYFESAQNDGQLMFAYFYLGELFTDTNQEGKAIQNYKKVDSIFQKTQSIFPIIRKTYSRLDAYYEKKNDLKNQLTYKNQLLKVDSILRAQESYISTAIFKDYDIPKLQAENEDLQTEKQRQKQQYNIAIIVLFVALIALLIGFRFQYLKRKTYKKRFQEVMNAPRASKNLQKQVVGTQKLSIPDDIVDDILQKLESFENQAEFISNTTTLNSLSKQFNTNPNYLSKVVNHYKKSSFSNYINNLRVEHAIEQLQSNPIFLKYTVKAIAAEVGFNNVQSFSKAFFNAKGINPSYFIRELKKVKK